MSGETELRARSGRAVLLRSGTEREGEADLGAVLGGDLAEALQEWARVCAAIRSTGSGAGGEIVSRRGRQLVGRVAAVLGESVVYRDPMTGEVTLVPPPAPPGARRRRAGDRSARLEGPREQGEREPTPWATGLTVSAFVAGFVLVAMLALAEALATETASWVAVLAVAVVSAGLAPSLWLGRVVPVVRWVVLGAAVGTVLSWIGVLLIAFT